MKTKLPNSNICAEDLADPISSLQGLWVYKNMPGLYVSGVNAKVSPCSVSTNH